MILGNTYDCSEEGEYIIFAIRKGAISNNLSRITYAYGCDGINHAVQICREDEDENGDIVFASVIDTKIVCKCTGSCNKKDSLGFF